MGLSLGFIMVCGLRNGFPDCFLIFQRRLTIFVLTVVSLFFFIWIQLKTFDQTVFFIPTPSDYSIDDVGYIYIPLACSNGTRSKKDQRY